MILLINTVDDNPYVALAKNAKLIGVDFLKGEGAKKSEDLTLAIQRIIKKRKEKITNIKSIAAVAGPGSFSGSRAGVAVANALGYSLGVPVLGIKKQDALDVDQFLKTALKQRAKTDIIVPIYDSRPNITKKTK